MNKTLKITTVLISSIFLITSCVSNDQHTHTPQYDWDRLRAISKITNSHNKNSYQIQKACDDKVCHLYSPKTDNMSEDDSPPQPPILGTKYKISPTVNKYGQPDIDIILIAKENSNILNNRFIELDRRKPTNFRYSNREKTSLTYHFTIKQCDINVDLSFFRPKQYPHPPSSNTQKNDTRISKEFSFVFSYAQSPECEALGDMDYFESGMGSSLTTTGRGRD